MISLPGSRSLGILAAAAFVVPNVAGWFVMGVDPDTGELAPMAPDPILRAMAALSVIGVGVATACVWVILVRFVSRRIAAGEKYGAGDLRGLARYVADPAGRERIAVIGAASFVGAAVIGAGIIAMAPSP